VVTRSLAAAVFSSLKNKQATADLTAMTSAAARAGFLGLHHDAITGTCPADVAEDFLAWAARGEALGRRVMEAAVARAQRCPHGGAVQVVAFSVPISFWFQPLEPIK
jgi:tagatose-1,6-bisphosphate aldolase non-catalytic subunit AgaZ/GatZ